MNDDFDYLLWAYRAVFKQTDGGGGTIIIRIVANERTVILYGLVGPNDYAADRTLSMAIDDGTTGQIIASVLKPTNVDNERIPFPIGGATAATANQGTEFEKRMVLGKGDTLVLTMLSIVQNEEVTLHIRALFRNWPPTVTTTGSGGTVTTTPTYDKVI